MNDGGKVLFKMDVKNAFNLVDRGALRTKVKKSNRQLSLIFGNGTVRNQNYFMAKMF